MADIDQSSVGNRLLARLPADDFAVIAPHLRRVDMAFRATLHTAGQPIAAAIFPEHGYASMLATLDHGDAAEVGMIGREGVIGLPLLFGSDRSSIEAMVQSGGSSLHLPADVFQQACEVRPAMRALLLRYAMAFYVQVTMTAACNGRHLVGQRFARWLLMAHDRGDGDEFPMTHEFLSVMLGVRRAGVSVAAGRMRRSGYIRYEQGRIRVIDRQGLESAACECHGIVRRETDRLMGAQVRR